jgi:hypothetical protein
MSVQPVSVGTPPTVNKGSGSLSLGMADGMSDCQRGRHGRNDWLSSHRNQNTCTTAHPTIAPTPTGKTNISVQRATLTGRVTASWLVGGLGLLPVSPPSDSVKTIVFRFDSWMHDA